MRIELLRLQILDPVISALVESDHTSLAREDASFSSTTDTVAAAASAASSSSSSSTFSFSHSSPHINALIIIKNMAQTDVVLTKLHVEVQEEATREGEEATSSGRGGRGRGPVTTLHLDAADLVELESFSLWGVVAAGCWKREFRGKLAMIASSLLDKGNNFVCDQGDVALLTGQQVRGEVVMAASDSSPSPRVRQPSLLSACASSREPAQVSQLKLLPSSSRAVGSHPHPARGSGAVSRAAASTSRFR